MNFHPPVVEEAERTYWPSPDSIDSYYHRVEVAEGHRIHHVEEVVEEPFDRGVGAVRIPLQSCLAEAAVEQILLHPVEVGEA
jgi:hypothetical protein